VLIKKNKMSTKKNLVISKSIEAERLLIEIANDIYTNVDLKPMSKSIFFLSRAFLIIKNYEIKNSYDLYLNYENYKKKLKNKKFLEDDYNFVKITKENKLKLDSIINKLNYIKELGINNDICGLIFNSLLRGKYEAGEGLGTFLTPEEIVDPMVEMLTNLYFKNEKKVKGLVGDIAGGTGRFIFSLKNQIIKFDKNFKNKINNKCFLFDQSNMSVSLAKINFYLENLYPNFFKVEDSLTSESVNKLKNKFSILATNPPFGSNKYKFNNDVKKSFDEEILNNLGFKNEGDTIDPAELFLIKNFQLLELNGVLGIVLPDGICKTNKITKLLEIYSKNENININLVARISLPSHSFSLTGTVVQSSFLIFQKSKLKTSNIYEREAQHIGYLKKGNLKIIDQKGNDLNEISILFKNFIKYDLKNKNFQTKKLFSSKYQISDYAYFPNDFNTEKKNNIHISILDIDRTGFIDVVQAINNSFNTKPKICNSNDILISCINPSKWRVALVPNLDFNFSCSPEFAIIRSNKKISSELLSLILQSKEVKEQVEYLGVGTSSSRQRVPKNKILEIFLPKINISEKKANDFYNMRNKIYKNRLDEYFLLKKII